MWSQGFVLRVARCAARPRAPADRCFVRCYSATSQVSELPPDSISLVHFSMNAGVSDRGHHSADQNATSSVHVPCSDLDIRSLEIKHPLAQLVGNGELGQASPCFTGKVIDHLEVGVVGSKDWLLTLLNYAQLLSVPLYSWGFRGEVRVPIWHWHGTVLNRLCSQLNKFQLY